MQIRIGHSPDSDDAFMFYAIAQNQISTEPFEITHVIEDIESLNRRALNSELEITAISVHAYAYVAENYALMPSGASIGDRYGPLVVTREPIDSLTGKTVAVPGTMTTAFLTLNLYSSGFEHVVVPFDQILEYVAEGKADAGLIIHEGQLTYAESGLHKLVDLGEWWYQETQLPLPLGANVIRRDLGDENIHRLCEILHSTISYSLTHRADALEYAMIYARHMGREVADEFVGMYVNDYTLDYGEKGRAGVRELLRRGYEAGVIPNEVPVSFVS